MSYRSEEMPILKNAWGGNIALAQETGVLTDQQIIKMTDDELERLAFTSIYERDGIASEEYRRTSDTKMALAQGGYSGEIYRAVARVHQEWEYRKQNKIAPCSRDSYWKK